MNIRFVAPIVPKPEIPDERDMAHLPKSIPAKMFMHRQAQTIQICFINCAPRCSQRSSATRQLMATKRIQLQGDLP